MSFITKIKSVLTKSKSSPAPKTTRELLQEKSSCAVSAIRTIISTLKDASTEIASEREANIKKMETLKEENQFYDALEADNGKIIANFENLLK